MAAPRVERAACSRAVLSGVTRGGGIVSLALALGTCSVEFRPDRGGFKHAPAPPRRFDQPGVFTGGMGRVRIPAGLKEAASQTFRAAENGRVRPAWRSTFADPNPPPAPTEDYGKARIGELPRACERITRSAGSHSTAYG